MKPYKRIVIKIGTNVITNEDGLLDNEIIKNITEQISQLRKENTEVIIVSSGAMGAGRSLVKIPANSNKVVRRQILASVGQIKLMETYARLFGEKEYVCAQVLATKEDFRDRHHYLNMRNCFEALLHDKIIPIVNENDVISVDELMFTDNDELAGLISSMLNVDALIMLTNVDGIYDKSVKNEKLQIIKQINPKETKLNYCITNEKSEFGRGGMMTKAKIAQKLALLGTTTHIVNGKNKEAIVKAFQKKDIGTTFLAEKELSNVKKWIAQAQGQEKGIVYINECAVKILKDKIKTISLLPIGITKIEGNFEKGDIVKICDEKGGNIGLGTTQYGSKKAREFIGQKNKKALIHYNYLFLEI